MSKKEINNEETETAAAGAQEEQAAEEKETVDFEKLLEEKEAELLTKAEQYQRLLAEYDNFKKRTIREKEGIYTDGVRDTVSELLPIIDNLNRALDAFEDKESEHCKGVEMVLKQTQEAFKRLGVSEIKSVGEQFDPELHNAVMHIEDDAVTENTVVEEFQKGYIYKDKVIRHSMVKVAN